MDGSGLETLIVCQGCGTAEFFTMTAKQQDPEDWYGKNTETGIRKSWCSDCANELMERAKEAEMESQMAGDFPDISADGLFE